MEIKSYKDAEGNGVRLGDMVEILYGEDPELHKVAKVVKMKKEGHWVWIRLEGDWCWWIWGTKRTRLVVMIEKKA